MTDLILKDLKQRVIDGEPEPALALAREALAAGCAPDVIFKEALFPAMDEVGRRMQCHEYFLPEVLLAARSMQACAAVVRPLIVKEPALKPIGKAVACTVGGDLHDIGRSLVCLMLEGAGFTVIDLGHDCPAQKIVAAVREHQPDVVALSAMLTTTMRAMGYTIKALEEAGLRDTVKIMVGGAPVDADFANRIGADGYGSNAPAGADLAKKFAAAG